MRYDAKKIQRDLVQKFGDMNDAESAKVQGIQAGIYAGMKFEMSPMNFTNQTGCNVRPCVLKRLICL